MDMVFNIIGAVGTIFAIMFSAVQLKKDREERERKQASCVSCWVSDDVDKLNNNEPMSKYIEIANESGNPIYNVVVSIDAIEYGGIMAQNGEFSYIKYIPPGKYYVAAPFGGDGMFMEFSASISFTDSNGLFWYRNAVGKLEKKKNDAVIERKVPLPVCSKEIIKATE